MNGNQVRRKVAAYARVSTGNQSTGLEAQVRALREYCVKNSIDDYVIYEDENQSGTKSSRPALDRMMAAVRRGEYDSVIVYSFSRYARSVGHLLRALEEFKERGLAFVSITENIDTSSPLGTAIFAILGAVAQLERDLIAERVRNGLANARAKGVKIGRKKQRPSDLIRTLRRSGLSYREISHITKVSQGAIGVELRLWKAELSKVGRTIGDEIAAYRTVHPKNEAVALGADMEPGISLGPMETSMTLELVR